uniref:Zerknuellt protein n=1 Tax=Clogmia albipunctata TaxID=85120 RepID=Q8WQH5_CLOAL|nr:zerknuellt protein [Clogmia albipunctata]
MFESMDSIRKGFTHEEGLAVLKEEISDHNSSVTNSTNPSPIPEYNSVLPSYQESSAMLLPTSPENTMYSYPMAMNPQIMEPQPVRQMPPQPKPVESPPQKKRSRTAYTSYQLVALERAFLKNNYISRPARTFMAKELGLIEKQIKIWFQNRRMKENKSNNIKPKQVISIKDRKTSANQMSREKQQQNMDKEFDHCIVTRLLSQRQQHFNQYASTNSSYNSVPRIPTNPLISDPPQYQMTGLPPMDMKTDNAKRISSPAQSYSDYSDYTNQFFNSNYYESSGTQSMTPFDNNYYFYDHTNYTSEYNATPLQFPQQSHTVSWTAPPANNPIPNIMEVPKMISL